MNIINNNLRVCFKSQTKNILHVFSLTTGFIGSTLCMTCFMWPDGRTRWIVLSSGYQESHPMPSFWRACQNEEDKP